MAVFRKFLSATKNKIKSPKLHYDGDGGETSDTRQKDEEFQRRKQEWQDELDEMSEFLVLKSTEEQREEGVDQPVDTAFIADRDGMPILKALFDIHLFKPDDVSIHVDGNALILEAKTTDDRDVAVFRRTMLRRLEIPEHVDTKMMRCDLSEDGILSVEMPFHLPPQRRPVGPGVVPIIDAPDGKRKIRLAFSIGPDFCSDDITVESDESIDLESVHHTLSPEGKLYVELRLKDEASYKCEVTTKDAEDDVSSAS